MSEPRPEPDILDGLPKHQLNQLAKAHDAAATMMHWRVNLVYEISRAIHHGCTKEQIALVIGTDVDGVDYLLRHRPEMTGVDPLNPKR